MKIDYPSYELKFVNRSLKDQGLGLKDQSTLAMINATKETYHLLTRILTFVSHFELLKTF